MPRWVPTLRRRPKPSGQIVDALEESFGPDAVTVLKQTSTSFGGLLALVRVGRRMTPRRGQEKLLQSYAEMPWVRAVVGKIAESVAATEWVVYRSKNVSDQEAAAAARFYSKASPQRRKRLRKQMELVELPGHALLDLLEDGNEFHTGQTIDELTQCHLELVGESFWLKERNGRGVPTELWNIPPNWVIDCPHPGEDDREFLFRVDGVETRVPMSEVIWFKKGDPYVPYGRGVGTGRSLGDELDTDEYAAKHMKGWFINGAIPDLLVSADGLNPADTERLEEDWLDKQQGFWNRFKPYFIGKKLTVEKLTSSFQEMGLSQLRKDQRDVIVHTWGVAPEMFGITQSSNRATITGAWYQFARWVLVPRLELKRVTLQTRLVPDFDPSLVLDYVSPVEEDREHVLKVMTAAPWAFTVDEWREEGGREELEDEKGKVHGTPFSLVFTDDLSGGGGGVTPEPEEPGEESDEGGDPVDPTEDSDEPGLPVTDSPDQVVTRQLSEQAEGIIGQVVDAIDSDVIDDAVRPVMEETVYGFGASHLDELLPGLEFDEADPKVVEFIKNGRKVEIKEITKTTQKKVRASLSEGYEAGESMAKLSARVADEFEDARSYRSFRIARTETVNSANFGAHEAIVQSGLGYKSWLAVMDDVTRDVHAALSSEPPIPVTEDFVDPNSGMSAPYPGAFGVAGEDINCRCSVLGEPSPAEGEAPSSRWTEEQRSVAWRSFEQSRLPYEREMKSSVDRGFTEQEQAALAALREAS